MTFTLVKFRTEMKVAIAS